MVLDLYFGPFWDKSEVMFFQKMAICEYLILAIFSRFWLFWAHFGPEMSKVYLFQLFRCKINNKIKKSGSIWLFQKLDPQSAPKSTQDPKTPLKGLRRAKIGTNASHSVQLTTLGPKKPDLNPTPQRSVPFTWNPPTFLWWKSLSALLKWKKDKYLSLRSVCDSIPAKQCLCSCVIITLPCCQLPAACQPVFCLIYNQ